MYSYSLQGYTWKSGLMFYNPHLGFLKVRQLLLLLENKIRGGVSSVMGDRYVESGVGKIFYIDALILYGWAMSQNLPTDDFEKFFEQIFTRPNSRRFVIDFGQQCRWILH